MVFNSLRTKKSAKLQLDKEFQGKELLNLLGYDAFHEKLRFSTKIEVDIRNSGRYN